MIEIKHLKTLQALRNSGSLAGAAAALHQTQSALSHQFSDLEQRLGFRLFVRKSQPLRFTPQGEILPGEKSLDWMDVLRVHGPHGFPTMPSIRRALLKVA